jgi:hypothetical protein
MTHSVEAPSYGCRVEDGTTGTGLVCTLTLARQASAPPQEDSPEMLALLDYLRRATKRVD